MGTVNIPEQELRQLRTKTEQLRQENQELENSLEKRENSNLTWEKVLTNIEEQGTLSDKELIKLLSSARRVGEASARRIVNSDEIRQNWIPVNFEWLVEKAGL